MSLTTGALSRLRGAYGDWRLDTCVHQTRGTSQDAHGQLVETYSDALTYACGVDLTSSQASSREIRQADQTVVQTDGVLRLPLSALGVVSAKDRIRLTKRTGETLAAAITYEIEGEPRPGVLGLICDLRRVT